MHCLSHTLFRLLSSRFLQDLRTPKDCLSNEIACRTKLRNKHFLEEKISLVIFSMIFQSLTFIGLFDYYNANEVNTMSTEIGWYLSLVLNGVITISIAVRSLEIHLLQQSVTLFLIRREYILCTFHLVSKNKNYRKIAKTTLTQAPEVSKLRLSNFHRCTSDYLK